MKILIIYTHNKGLLSDFYQELSKMLVDDGHEVVNFYLKHQNEAFELSGVQMIGRPKGSLWQNYLTLFKAIQTTKPDVVVSNFSYINPALLCGTLLGVKRNIAWFHTAYGHSKRHWFHVWFKKQCFKWADVVITNSHALSHDMTTYYGVRPQQLRPIPFWTNIGTVKAHEIPLGDNPPQTLKIGCPGRLVTDKNQALVLKTLSQIDSPHSWKLYIAGNGPDSDALKDLIGTLHLERKVVCLGKLSAEAMKSFYQSMDVIVLPSLHEAFGLVFIEAIALGRPVLVSSRFGALDHIDGTKFSTQAFTFDPTSVLDLKAKLIPYLGGTGLPGTYFKTLYDETFDKAVIYGNIKAILTDT